MAENRFSCPSDAMRRDPAPPVSFHSHMGTASGNCWTETKRGEASGAGATNKMPIVIAGNARMAHSPFFRRMERILYQRFRRNKFCGGGRMSTVRCLVVRCLLYLVRLPNHQMVNWSMGHSVIW